MNRALQAIVDAIAADLGSGDVADADQWGRPFVWQDPSTLPARRWLYKPHFIRGYVTVTFAAGGAGKTTLLTSEALAVATGRPLLRVTPTERVRVWLWNGEDPADEMQRRIQAAMLHHDLPPHEVEGWLFTGSGRDADLVIAEQTREGAAVCAPIVGALVEFIRAQDISVLAIDPFVSCHRVSENDNGAIDRVAKAWAQVAHETGCAVHLVHHTRKTNGHEASVEDGRGASALLSAARYARVLNTMQPTEAARLGVEERYRRLYVRIDEGKQNLTPPAAHAEWFRLTGVDLGNGDNVQVAMPWTPPDPFDALSPADVRRVQDLVAAGSSEGGPGWRWSVQAGDWVGHAVAEALGLDLEMPGDMARAKELIKGWMGAGILVRVDRSFGRNARVAPFVEVGRWIEPESAPHLAKVGGGKVGE